MLTVSIRDRQSEGKWGLRENKVEGPKQDEKLEEDGKG